MAVNDNIKIENVLLFGFKRKCYLVEQTEISIKSLPDLEYYCVRMWIKAKRDFTLDYDTHF